MIYFDNAATGGRKPDQVMTAVNSAIRVCANPGRSGHKLALSCAGLVQVCRNTLNEYFNGYGFERVVFTKNCSEALNIAILGVLQKGDHVIMSCMEHNSVWRPIYKLAKDGIIEYSIFPSMCGDPRANPTRICAGIARLIRPSTRLLICAHSSNVCSYSLPIKEIGAFCRRHGILFAVDAAQSAGHLPIDMGEMKIDALCAPGHKGLYGIQGVGFMALSENVRLETLAEGGNGLSSLEGDMSAEFPERHEAGTLPTPAIVGLAEGIRVVSSLGLDRIEKHERALFEYTRKRLSEIEGIRIYMPEYSGSVLLFSHKSIHSEELTAKLGDLGICLRGGFHCSALGHKALGTSESGAVRASFGIFNSSSDVDRLADALSHICK